VSGIKKIKKEISEITRDAGDLRNKKKSTAGAKSELMNRLTKDAEVVLQKLKIKNAVVEITMLPDAQMRFLEKKYMKKEKKIVDVLSFVEPKEFPRPDTKKKILGQVYLNSEENKNNPNRLRFLLIHGILHILGYGHYTPDDSIIMETLEKKLWHHVLSLGSILEPQRSRPLSQNAREKN
jgi:probable rRNA maturation factor